jgi:hypothetical protein
MSLAEQSSLTLHVHYSILHSIPALSCHFFICSLAVLLSPIVAQSLYIPLTDMGTVWLPIVRALFLGSSPFGGVDAMVA